MKMTPDPRSRICGKVPVDSEVGTGRAFATAKTSSGEGAILPKILAELQENRAQLRMLNMKIEALTTGGKPGLTVREFAKKAGISESTVYRLNLPRVRGKVPYSCLKPYLT